MHCPSLRLESHAELTDGSALDQPASDSLRLCTYELERAANIRHNEEVMQQLGIKSLPMPTPANKETRRKRLTVLQSPSTTILTRTSAQQSKHRRT